jgi:hypothetical protein
MPLQQVHLRVNDAATGRPTPVRLRVTDGAGTYYPPYGRMAEFPHGRGEDVGGNLLVGRERWTYIDGSCEIAVLPGELTVEAVKGPEYRPLRETVDLPAGKLALRFVIERWTDLRQSDWYSGDIRAHAMSPHAALLEAAAEDLAVVNLLAREVAAQTADGQTYLTIPNLLAFSGQKPCVESDGHLVAVNTLNAHPVLGRLALLHCHRVVYPLTFGGSEQTDDWSLADWCGQCHRKHGLLVWVDAFDPKCGHAGEALANLILGEIDAVELNAQDPGRLRMWYHLLNAGLRVPIVGGSGKDSNRTPLGMFRTYVRLAADEPFSYTRWIEAVRAGRTYVSSGPLVTFQINGADAGADVPSAGSVCVRYGVRGLEPVERVDLLVNGAVAASGDGADVERELAVPAGGWVAIRCLGHGRLLAHTSPVYVRVGDVPPPTDPAPVAALDQHLVRAREWVESEGRFDRPKSRDRLLATFDAARDALRNASAKRR